METEHKEISAGMFPQLYEMLGINVNELRCVMADLEVEPFQEMIDIPEDSLYYTEDVNQPWVNGAVGKQNPHVSVLYGLMDSFEVEFAVKEVLTGWTLDEITIEEVGMFEKEDYYCVIGHVAESEQLEEGFQRLSLLPHINTYGEYKPHVTLAYVKKTASIEPIIANLNKAFAGSTHKVRDINMGTTKKVIELKDIK